MRQSTLIRLLVAGYILSMLALVIWARGHHPGALVPKVGSVSVHQAVAFDRSRRLTEMAPRNPAMDLPECGNSRARCGVAPVDPAEGAEVADVSPPTSRILAGSAAVEQTVPGNRPAAKILASFDGLGAGFSGPQGTRRFTNPSDNALAVGHDHIVQIVNGGMAVFTKKGRLFDTTGRVLYGPVASNAIFTGFGGPCESRNSGDAVVRYDQLADRWLYVLPIFQQDTTAPEEFTQQSRAGQRGQPGVAGPGGLINRPPPPPPPTPPPGGAPVGRGAGGRGAGPRPTGPYSICYAVSVGTDPLGPYYRYEFIRPLFPDYPRPAIWPDGYYVPSSTSDNLIQKHACVADRAKMLQGLPATEQCIVIDGVNFLNNADIDGRDLPPPGAPNIVMAAGGSQLRRIFEDDGIYAWKFHVDWETPANTGLSGPVKLAVAPYHYLCNGQLTRCVTQPGDSTRLDAQGDKLMQRLVYRNVAGHESILAEHSIHTSAGGGGVRWYEFRLDASRDPVLYQQGTYAPDGRYRWLASMAMDRVGNIGVGYSYGGVPDFAGQRFAARLAGDPPGLLTLHETILAEGTAAQNRATRWEDYTTTTMDPSDDCTFWYVGDYVKANATGYSSRIGGFRLPGCLSASVTGSAFLDLDHDGVRDAGEPGIPGWTVRWTGGQEGRAITNASGAFTTTLPADPLYVTPAFVFSAANSSRAGWQATGASLTSQRGAVIRSGWNYSFTLRDRDYVTGIDFGSVCSVSNQGGVAATFWATPKGRALLLSHDVVWRKLIDTTLHLSRANGQRFAAAGSPEVAADQLGQWLGQRGVTEPWERASMAAATASLNAAIGTQDGFVTLPDSARGGWASVTELVSRLDVLLAARPADKTSAVTGYTTSLERLNENRIAVTPSRPERCARPF